MKMSLKCHCPVQLLLTSLHQALSWDCLSASDIAFFFLHNSMVLLITEYWSQSFPNFIETEKVHSTFLWISMEFHRHLSYSWACVFILQLNMMVSFLLLSNQHDITWNPYLFFFFCPWWSLTVKILKTHKSNFCFAIKRLAKCFLKDKKGHGY